MKPLSLWIWVILLTGLTACVTGCKTDDGELSERPWNAPKTWETGLPSSLTEGR